MTLDKTLRQTRLFVLPALAGLFLAAACATVTPVELTDARTAYARASAGPAAQYTPVDLHKAKVALDKAEECFAAEKDSQKAVDLAYIAERTAQIAEATAQIAISTERTATAGKAFGDEQGQIIKDTKGALAKSRTDLAASERGQAEQVQKTEIERTGRQDAETKAVASEQKAAASDEKVKEANDALAKLAAKDDARGLVITLSGGVLFRSNEATLLPGAQTRLNEVADALSLRSSNVVVEGYTDSRGSRASNMDLSQRRADSVRGYLVSRGFPRAKIQARGLGPDRPIAENTSSEGRANNRRVEIVIDETTMPTKANGPTTTAPATPGTTSSTSRN